MTYTPQYALAWMVAVVGVIAGALAAAYLLPAHPSWLTQDLAATAGVVTTVCVGLASLLPRVTRTPQVRERAYRAARAGALPKDIVEKDAKQRVRDAEVQRIREVP